MANSYADQMALSKLHGWHVYVLSMPGFCKIGSAVNPKYRLESLQNGNPYPLKVEVIWHFSGRAEARAVEAAALVGTVGRLSRRDWCQCEPSVAVAAVDAAIITSGFAAVRVEI